MFSLLSKKINEIRKNIRLSFTKTKEFKDSVLNITKLIKWQIKLVDTILQRDKNSYKKNNLKLKSISDSDWVYGYIIRLSHAYVMQTKKLRRNSRAIMFVARDVLYSLGINQEIKYGELVADYYVKEKFEEKGTDYFRGGEIGESDYNNFLKISDKKDKVNKILPCMELTQYLCSQLGMPPIHETEDDEGEAFTLNKQKETIEKAIDRVKKAQMFGNQDRSKEKYIGDYKNGKKHGRGTLTSADGDTYIGEFLNDLFHGEGTWIDSRGSKYVGGYKNGLWSGHGEMTHHTGHHYIGEFKNNLYHGEGTLTYAKGDTYVGFWKEGVMHGKGIFKYQDGQVDEGIWEDGKLK